jgi:hypothetical protein
MTAPQPISPQYSGQQMPAGHEPANLGDLLERVLDRGLVIAGDIRVSLLDIELLTIKLRLVIASVDTARQMGIDWWEQDPWLSSSGRRQVESAAARGGAIESEAEPRDAIESGDRPANPARRAAVRDRQDEREEY